LRALGALWAAALVPLALVATSAWLLATRSRLAPPAGPPEPGPGLAVPADGALGGVGQPFPIPGWPDGWKPSGSDHDEKDWELRFDWGDPLHCIGLAATLLLTAAAAGTGLGGGGVLVPINLTLLRLDPRFAVALSQVGPPPSSASNRTPVAGRPRAPS